MDFCFSYRIIESSDSIRCHVSYVFDDYSCPVAVLWVKNGVFGYRLKSKFGEPYLSKLVNRLKPILFSLISE